MQRKIGVPVIAVAAFSLLTVAQANAQSMDEQLRNLQRNINIDITNGFISPQQGQDMQNRIGQLKAENAQYETMSGGRLTPSQFARLNAEMADLNGYRHWDHGHGALWAGDWHHGHHGAHGAVAPIPAAQVPVGARHGDRHDAHVAGVNPVARQEVKQAEHHEAGHHHD